MFDTYNIYFNTYSRIVYPLQFHTCMILDVIILFRSNGRSSKDCVSVRVLQCSCICISMCAGGYTYIIILLSMYSHVMYRVRWLMRFTRFEFAVIKNVNNNNNYNLSTIMTANSDFHIINVYLYNNNTTHLPIYIYTY